MKLCSRLHGGSLIRFQRETGARRFLKWQKFFEEEDRKEVERTEKWEHYAAQVCACIFAAQGAKDVDLSKFLQKFTVKAAEPTSQVTREQRIKEASNFWSAFFAVHKSVDDSALKPKKKESKHVRPGPRKSL